MPGTALYKRNDFIKNNTGKEKIICSNRIAFMWQNTAFSMLYVLFLLDK